MWGFGRFTGSALTPGYRWAFLLTRSALVVSLSLVSLGVSAPVVANGSSTSSVGAFSDFRVGGIAVKGKGDSSDALSLDLHWTPSLSHQDLSVRLDIGLSLVNLTDKNPFAIFGYEVFFGQRFDPSWVAEMGGGFQNWLENGGLTPVLSSHILWSPATEATLLQNIYAGFSKTFQDQASWQFRLGLALRIY